MTSKKASAGGLLMEELAYDNETLRKRTIVMIVQINLSVLHSSVY